jgi:hypothetical protein
MENAQAWAKQQFGEVCLGDQRRTQRAVKMAGQMAREPFGSLPKQMKSWEAQKGAYRLLDNRDVSHHQLSEPHWRHTREAARQTGSVILMVQDFTDLNYTSHPATQGLGPISSQAFLSGLWVHNTLAIQPQERRVLGLAYQQVWAREESTYKGRESKTTRRKRSNRQSLRWGQAVAAIGKPPDGVKWVYVADREADMFEFFENILSMGADFCIRLVQERRLADWTVEQPMYLLKTVRDVPEMGQRILEIPASPRQAARQAQLAVSWQSVTLRSPRNTPGEDKYMTAWAVRTWEKEPPADSDPIEWLLITSVPVQSLPEALERIEWYTCRWIIEEYHRCLKTGCNIEKTQLRHAERIQRLLAFLAILAVRLLQLRDLSRSTPHLLAIDHIDPVLVQIIALCTNKKPNELSLGLFWFEVAKLGGFPARRSDGDPGWLRLWRGWLQLLDLAEGVRIANLLPPIEHDVGNP